jgi:hypothetical protein
LSTQYKRLFASLATAVSIESISLKQIHYVNTNFVK